MAKKRQSEKDRATREKIGSAWWASMGLLGLQALAACCGGHGLVVGCPACGKRR